MKLPKKFLNAITLLIFLIKNIDRQLVLSEDLNLEYEHLLLPVGKPPPIAIGLVYGEGKTEIHNVLQQVVQQQSPETRKAMLLAVDVDVINTADVYKLSKIICNQFQRGAFTMIGAVSPSSFATFHSYANLFKVPFVTTWFPEKVLKPTSGFNDYAISMTPDYHKAVSATIEYYGWKSVIYIYESLEGLSRLEELLSDIKPGDAKFQFFNIKQVSNAPDAISYLNAIEAQNRWSNKYVVLDCSIELTKAILIAHVRDPLLGRRNYHYFVTALVMDAQWENLREYGSINVTGFRIINRNSAVFRKFIKIYKAKYNSDSLGAESAIYYDGMHLAIAGLSEFQKNFPEAFTNFIISRKKENHTNMIDCNPSTTNTVIPFIHGAQLLNILKKTEFEGITGTIRFNKKGNRKNITLQIVEMKAHNTIITVAEWSDHKGLTPIVPKAIPLGVATNIERNRTYVVTSLLKTPYLMKSIVNGKENYFGFCKDILDRAAEMLEIKYNFSIVSDGLVGSQNPNAFGRWDGMIGELVRKEVDMALCPLEVSLERERYVEFSKPFITVELISPKKTANKQQPNNSWVPFTKEMLICLGFTFVGVSIILYITVRFSPGEWQVVRTNSPENEATIINKFNFSNTLFHTFSSLVHQDSGFMPKSLGGRIVSVFWGAFCVIVIIHYLANLTTYIVIINIKKLTEDVSTSRNQRIYGTQDFPSMAPTFAIEHDFLENPSWMTKLYNTEKDQEMEACDQVVIVWNEAAQEFAFAFPKGSALREGINLAIQSMKNSGELQHLIRNWFSKSDCDYGLGLAAPQVTFANMSRHFYVLIIGLSLGLTITVTSICMRKIKQYRNERLEESPIEMEVVNERPPTRALSHENEPAEGDQIIWNDAPCAECNIPITLEHGFPAPPPAFMQARGCVRRPATVRRAATSVQPPNVELYQL